MTVEEFVLRNLPRPPVRVLEVGCGRGELARRMAAAGHRVLAIDPDAPEGTIFERFTLEELVDPGPFDAVVASRSLHHVGDLMGALDKVWRLLASQGVVVLDEHAFDRLDERTASWYFDRARELARRGHRPSAPGDLESCRREWAADREHLHDSRTMLAALDRHFSTRLLTWGPYLHGELGEVADAAEERRLIEAGRIQAMGFRYVGERRP